MTATAATGTLLGVGGLAYAQNGQFGTIRLGGVVAGWQGRAPAAIEGQTNPTLPLQVGQDYTIVWENVDGEPHNVAILDETGSVVVRSDIISEQGATQRVEFTAEQGMTTYLCQVHPTSMRGPVTLEGDGAMADNETMPGNVTNETTTPMPTTQVPVNETAWGEAPLHYIAAFGDVDPTEAAAGENATADGAENVTVEENVTETPADENVTVEENVTETPADENVTVEENVTENETGMPGQQEQGPQNATMNETDDGFVATANETVENGEANATQNATMNETDDGFVATADENVTENETGTMGREAQTPNQTDIVNITANATADPGEVQVIRRQNVTQVSAAEQISAVRFTVQPVNGGPPKMLYNIAIWDVEDVVGAEIRVDGEVVAVLLSLQDAVDYPAGVVAIGTVMAGDLMGPLADRPLRALVQQIEMGNASVVVRTDDQDVLQAPIRRVPTQPTDDNQTVTDDQQVTEDQTGAENQTGTENETTEESN